MDGSKLGRIPERKTGKKEKEEMEQRLSLLRPLCTQAFAVCMEAGRTGCPRPEGGTEQVSTNPRREVPLPLPLPRMIELCSPLYHHLADNIRNVSYMV